MSRPKGLMAWEGGPWVLHLEVAEDDPRGGAVGAVGQMHRQADELVPAGRGLAQVEALERDDRLLEQSPVGVAVADGEVVDADQADAALEHPLGAAAVQADEVVGEL